MINALKEGDAFSGKRERKGRRGRAVEDESFEAGVDANDLLAKLQLGDELTI